MKKKIYIYFLIVFITILLLINNCIFLFNKEGYRRTSTRNKICKQHMLNKCYGNKSPLYKCLSENDRSKQDANIYDKCKTGSKKYRSQDDANKNTAPINCYNYDTENCDNKISYKCFSDDDKKNALDLGWENKISNITNLDDHKDCETCNIL